MSINDLAGGGLVGSYTPELLYAGEAPIVTDAAPAVADEILKYEVLVLTEAGLTRITTTPGDNDDPDTINETGAQCVIAAQPASAGDQVPYFAAGKFNHAVLVWPDDLDTYEKRKVFFHGTDIHIGHIA